MRTKFNRSIKALERERKLVVAEAISLLLGKFKKGDNLSQVDIFKMVARNEKITKDIDEAIELLKKYDKTN